MAKTVTLTHNRETKGTHVYKDADDAAPIPSLYIAKEAFKDPAKPPPQLTITIKEL